MEKLRFDESEISEYEDTFKIPSVGHVKFDLECKYISIQFLVKFDLECKYISIQFLVQ